MSAACSPGPHSRGRTRSRASACRDLHCQAHIAPLANCPVLFVAQLPACPPFETLSQIPFAPPNAPVTEPLRLPSVCVRSAGVLEARAPRSLSTGQACFLNGTATTIVDGRTKPILQIFPLKERFSTTPGSLGATPLLNVSVIEELCDNKLLNRDVRSGACPGNTRCQMHCTDPNTTVAGASCTGCRCPTPASATTRAMPAQKEPEGTESKLDSLRNCIRLSLDRSVPPI